MGVFSKAIGKVFGGVHEVDQIGDTLYAYLYAFKVDSAALRNPHKDWLSERLLGPAGARTPAKRTVTVVPDGPVDPWSGKPLVEKDKDAAYWPHWKSKPQPGSTIIVTQSPSVIEVQEYLMPESWAIFLCGTTSRTASDTHNLKLSKARVQAVAAYIRKTLDFYGVQYYIDTFWTGELLAKLAGKPDHQEDPLDRAVLIAFRPIYQTTIKLGPPPLPLRQRPGGISCSSRSAELVKLEIEFIEAVRESWAAHGPEIWGHSTGRAPTGRLSADPLPMGSIPTTQPEYWQFYPFLTGRGWSATRALEIHSSESGRIHQLISEPITTAPTKTQKLDTELANLREELSQCADSGISFDPSTHEFRKR